MGLLLAVVVLLVAGFANAVSAQPTDAELKKQLTHAKTVSVTLGKPGTREWSSTYKKYVWNRHFTAKLKTDDPDIFVIVKGYASYDLIGGRHVFWRTFTTSNNYEGIPDPSAADVQALIGKFGLQQFLGSYFHMVIGKVESIGLADEPSLNGTRSIPSRSISLVFTPNGRTTWAARNESRVRRASACIATARRPSGKACWSPMTSTGKCCELSEPLLTLLDSHAGLVARLSVHGHTY
ncbi:MAG TPA: hypothetical protein VMM84_01580 [Pyrinomonadaceae bacterium]|nr:hypothetical protein [Pyrinomonadaceae bacterium]